MIHYHGGPIDPLDAAAKILKGRHAMIAFGRLEMLTLAAEVCQSFVLDNGAFSVWRQGRTFDKDEYEKLVRDWSFHPAFDWALIPDVIDGDEKENDALIRWWEDRDLRFGVPVWHLHESLERLARLCRNWDRVAIGSSGDFSKIGTSRWFGRMAEAMNAICVDGRPMTKLHGLRMLDPKIFAYFPFSSADSTNVAQNVGVGQKWHGRYLPPTKAARGTVIAERIEAYQSASLWEGIDIQDGLFSESHPVLVEASGPQQ